MPRTEDQRERRRQDLADRVLSGRPKLWCPRCKLKRPRHRNRREKGEWQKYCVACDKELKALRLKRIEAALRKKYPEYFPPPGGD